MISQVAKHLKFIENVKDKYTGFMLVTDDDVVNAAESIARLQVYEIKTKQDT